MSGETMPKRTIAGLLYAYLMLPGASTAADLPANDPVHVAGRAQLSVQLAGPKALAVRAPGRYTVQVQNDGSAAVPVAIEVRVAAHVEITATKPPADVNGAVASWKLASIPPNDKAMVSFEAVAQSAQPVAIEAIARPAIVVALQTPLQVPKLELSVRGPKSCEYGQPVVCTAIVTNSGAAAVAKGGLQVFASPGVRVRPSNPQQGPFQLAPGQSLETPLVLELTGDGPQGLKILAQADDAPSATAEHRFLVRRPRVDVDLDGPTRLIPGQIAEFRLTVTNVGTSAIARAYGFIELPDIVEFVTAAEGGVHDERRRLVYWPADGLEPRRRATFSLTLRALRPGTLEIRGSAKETTGTDAETYLTGTVAARSTAAP
jgi:hypothetical protein